METLFPADMLGEIFKFPISLAVLGRLSLVNKHSTRFEIFQHVQSLIITDDPADTGLFDANMKRLNLHYAFSEYQEPSKFASKPVPGWMWKKIASKCINLSELSSSVMQVSSDRKRGIKVSVSAVLKRLNKLTILAGAPRDQHTLNMVIGKFSAKKMTELHIFDHFQEFTSQDLVHCFPNLRRVTLPIQTSQVLVLKDHPLLERIDCLPAVLAITTPQEILQQHDRLACAPNLRYNMYRQRFSLFDHPNLEKSIKMLHKPTPICCDVVINALSRGVNLWEWFNLIRSPGQFSAMLPSWNEIKQRITPIQAIRGMVKAPLSGQQLVEYIQALQPELSQKFSALVAIKDRNANILWESRSSMLPVLEMLKHHDLIPAENVLQERDPVGYSIAHYMDESDLVHLSFKILGEELFTQLHTTPEPYHFNMPIKIQLPLVHFWKLRRYSTSLAIMQCIPADRFALDDISDPALLPVALEYAQQCYPNGVEWTYRVFEATDLRSISTKYLASVMWQTCLKKDAPDLSLHLRAMVWRTKEAKVIPDFFNDDDDYCARAINALKSPYLENFNVDALAEIIGGFGEHIIEQFSFVETKNFSVSQLVFAGAMIECEVMRRDPELGKLCAETMKQCACLIQVQRPSKSETLAFENSPNQVICASAMFLNLFQEKAYAYEQFDPFLNMLEWLLDMDFGPVEEPQRRSLLRAQFSNV